MKANKVRIIGGRWRGRQINFPDVEGLRPSGDRIRETLFNWLQNSIVDAQCLDLFSGSGVLGFEALSRGAKHVIFIDESREIIGYLQKNAQQLSAKNCDIILESFPSENLNLKFKSENKKFDIVFLDPPFKKNLIFAALQWLDNTQILAENALIYVECQRGTVDLVVPENFKIIKSKNAGQVSYYLVTNLLSK